MTYDWQEAVNAAAAVEEFSQAQEIVPRRRLHIDGDYAAYFCAGGSDTEAGVTRIITDNKIEQAAAMCGASSVHLHLTHAASDKGQRYFIASVKPYQGQRKGHKPKNWAVVREYLETARGKNWTRHVWADREADDGLGLASSVRDPVAGCVLFTKDKDMQMLPGTHMDWVDYTLVHVPVGAYEVYDPLHDKVYGHKWFWLQMLQGDTADHIPGLEKYEGKDCGAVTAATLLAGTHCNDEAYEVVSRAYETTYGDAWADRLVEQAGLLWIRTTTRAPIHEFLRVVPSSREVLGAITKLKRRVTRQRNRIAQINEGGASGLSQEVDA
jgi:DNA polymerase-1